MVVPMGGRDRAFQECEGHIAGKVGLGDGRGEERAPCGGLLRVAKGECLLASDQSLELPGLLLPLQQAST